MGTIATCTFCATVFGIHGPDALPWYILSATIYTAGRLSDRVSTVKFFDTQQKAKSLGLEAEFTEANKYFPAKPDKSQLFSAKKTIIDAGYLIPGIIFPPEGLFLGLGSYLASVSNDKLRQGLEAEIRDKINSDHESV